jgi:DNA mismatch repair protein MutS2
LTSLSFSTATAQALELPRLLAVLGELAATDLGRDRVAGLVPATDPDDLARRRARYADASRLVPERPLVPSLEGSVADLLERVATGRPALTGADLVRLGEFLRAARDARRRAEERFAADARDRSAQDGGDEDEEDGEKPEPPALVAWLRALPDLDSLTRRIGQVLDRRGDVRDDASPELARLRGRIRGVRGRLYETLSSYVQDHRETLAEDTVPMRGGRLMVMLPSGSRGRLAGLTHGRSATGKSFYFEPIEMVESNNDLQQAVEDDEAERHRLLAELVGAARKALPQLEKTAEIVAELDLLQAAVRFAGLADARLPEVCAEGLEIRGARHPLLDPKLSDLRRAALGHPGHQGAVIPLDFELSEDRRVLVVTGPNAGGKTVALKTVGLLTLTAQCGLPVPVAEGTRLPYLTGLVAIVGDEQDLLTDRSTFSGRLLRLQEAWEQAAPGSLLLLDELGSGTDPEEGAALSVALLEEILDRGALAVITTHLTQLAAAALESEGAGCAAMEFDDRSGEPTYRLLPGPPGGSEAIALARRLGLPAVWLDRAEARLGSEHRRLRKLLGEVERVRRELGDELAAAEEARRDAGLLRDRIAERERELADERRKLAQGLRHDLDAFRREVRDRMRDEVARLRESWEQGRRQGLAEEASRRLFETAPEIDAPEPEPAGPLELGDRVRHRTLGWEGVLERLEGQRAEISVKGKRVRLPADELEPLDDPTARKKKKVSVQLAPRSGMGGGDLSGGGPDLPGELKLIGERVEPAVDRLDDYLDRALLSAHGSVRIVHGHGSGRLKKAVREHLRHHPAVSQYRAGGDGEGGDGATVVQLRK